MSVALFEKNFKKAAGFLGLVLAKASDGDPDAGIAILCGSGVPTSATYGGQTLASGQNAIAYDADAAGADALVYLTVDGGTTWTTIPSLPLTLADLTLASVGSVTISGAGLATFTGGANVVQGATNPDDLSDIAGIADGYAALMIAGTGVTNLVDSATLATPRNATIALAEGDRVLIIRSGTVHYAIPLWVQAGVPTSSSGTGASGSSTASVSMGGSTASSTATITVGGNTASDGTGATGADGTGATGADGTGATSSSGSETVQLMLPMPLLGAWAVDGDAWTGGLVGDVVNLTTTPQAAAYAVVYDHGTTTYALLSASAGMGGGGVYTANFQVFPDAETIDDAVYFGGDLPFAEIGLDGTATVGVYANDSCVWEYWNGAAWGPLPAGSFYDSSSTTPTDGARPFTANANRALVLVPPSDWATTTVNGQLAYWVRSRVIAANITTPALLADEHSIILGEAPWVPTRAGNLVAVWLHDNAATLHTGADITVVLYDSFTGASRTLTWHQDHRKERIAIASMACTTSTRLHAYVVQEDGTNEPTGVMATLEYEVTTTSHTHTGPSHTHTGPSHTHTGPAHTHAATGLTATDAGHTHAATGLTATDSGHTHTGPAHTHNS